ncbi:MAG: glycerol-3-phosphate dehydrogenase/oxidase [Acidimicrobiales bacterium]|nr:glycerol-3-phosphate dehydrogenase/oxidase [Acidimicrobiales bacterium]
MPDPVATAFCRDRSLERLASERFDLLVVGGGVTGAGIALDAASRGLSVALVDKADLASGTSSKSSKLVHGGLRYLQQGEFGLVYQALAERRRLLRNAPHLVAPLSFVVPILRSGGIIDRRLARALGLGLWQYDLTGGARLGWHRRLDVDEVLARLPQLRRDQIASGYLYWDAWVDDARLALVLARTAALDHGAVVANYARLAGVGREGGPDGRVTDAVLEVDGRTIEVACDGVVNACGVWAEEVQGLTGVADTFDIRPAKGVHLTVPAARLSPDGALLIPVKGDKRSIFVLPWPGGRTYIGTTDTDFDGELDEPRCTADDVAYLLDAVNSLTDADLVPGDVTGSWAGLRPLVATAETERTADLSRHHLVQSDESGVVTVTGGKLTTYRRMAQDTVDAVCELRGERRRCRTKRLPLLGVTGNGVSGADPHLAGRFGSEASTVLDLIRDDPLLGEPLVPGLPYRRAEAVHAVRSEMAVTLDDVLSRRTRARLEDRRATLVAAPEVAALVGEAAGWTDERCEAEVAAFWESVEAEVAAESA